MKRFLTTGFLGAILGLLVGAPADASLISRGFLDEALENYATTTALDLKANLSDLTALSNKIGTLPSGEIGGFPGYELLFPGPNKPSTYPTSLAELITAIYGIPEDGGVGLLAGIIGSFRLDINEDGSPDRSVGIIPNFVLANDANNLANANATKIGTLPEGITVQGMYEGWTDSNKFTYSGLNTISQDYTALLNDFNTPGLYSLFVKGGTLTIPGFPPDSKILSLYELSNGVSKIGTLPSGNFPEFPGYEFLTNIDHPGTYPTSLAELISDIYGFSENGTQGLLGFIINGFPSDTNGDGSPDAPIGLIPNFVLARDANDLANANTAKIGTLPSGNFPIFPGHVFLFPWLKQPLTYPTSLAELITGIYGNSETGGPGLLAAIITGFPVDRDGDGETDEYAGLLPNLDLTKDAIDLANANATKIGDLPTPDTTVAGMMGNPVLLNKEQTIIPLYNLILRGSNGQIALDTMTGMTLPFPLLGLLDITAKVNKIGDLPTEYATVGAALTAMKSDIDAKNLPSTSDDGQYVLSAKKVGDTITYTWVRMDLTSEEQAQ